MVHPGTNLNLTKLHTSYQRRPRWVSLVCCVAASGIADAATVSIIPTTDAIAYVPHHTITENVKQNEETNKETAIETTQPIKEITPPPAYIADTSSPVPEALSNIDVLDSTSEAHRKSSDIKPRAIKPLPQRNEPKTSLERSSDKGKTVPYTEKTGLGESKDIVDQTKDIHSVACLGKAVDFLPPPAPSQPYVFVAGNSGLQFPSKGFPSSSFAPASTSSSAFTTTAFPAPTAVFGLSRSSQDSVTPRQTTTLPIRSSAVVPSSAPAPTAVFGLTSSPLPMNVPTQSTHTSAQSSNTSTQSTNLTIPSSSIAPPPVYTPTATAVTTPPRGTYCPNCSAKNEVLSTSSSNPLNAGRAYRLCSCCGSWNGFADTRGLTPGLYCHCSPPAELRLVAKNKQDRLGRREAFYSCQYKACGAWSNHVDGFDVTLFTETEIRQMIREGRI
ncbi:hypothetical protein KJE20_01541 [Pyrenophora tritici-repentis]|nr:hypothetical protein KJE20_01541 [Pyrenophora tritici-repentis]